MSIKEPRPLSSLTITPTKKVVSVRALGKGRINFKTKLGSEENNMNEVNCNKPVEYMSAEETEKTAAWFSGSSWDNFKGGLMATGGAMLAGAAIGGTKALVGSYLDQRKYEQNLKLAVQLAPSLQKYPLDVLMSYLPMIAKASPTVASDPRLLANYLESMLDAEGHLNLSTFGELSNLEGRVLQNQALANPYQTEFIKGLSKGIGSSAGSILSNYANTAPVEG